MNGHRAIVLFDAVGSVIKPRADISTVYHQLGTRYGSRLGQDEIKRRISAARRTFFNVGASAKTRFADSQAESTTQGVGSTSDDLESSDELERKMWRRLVFDVFKDLETRGELFDELWSHFAQPENWEVYPDVAVCWNTLWNNGFEIGLVSNFDSRLIGIVDSLPEISAADYVFCSSQVGFRKPSPLFYRQVEEAMRCVTAESPLNDLKIVMVGDDFENDCVAPRLAGWSAVWLNRNRHARSEPVSTATTEVVSLDEFTEWVFETLG